MTVRTEVTRDPSRAAACLSHGGLVAIPTETVYGLAAVATDEDAVRRVFAAKGRPADHPLIVHVSSMDMALRHGDLGEDALRLAASFWPGPLTLVVGSSPLVPPAVTGGRDTVALRMPRHPLALAVIEECGSALVAPSANRFGHVSPTEAGHVLDDLGGSIDMVLDGGPCDIGLESTIVECAGSLQVLRPGAVTISDIEACTGRSVSRTTGDARAPGMLAAHYAPRASVLLAEEPGAARALRDAETAAGRSAVIIGEDMPTTEYASLLYRLLRAADADGHDSIVALLPGGDGLAAAVRDRLARAATGSRRG